VAFGLNAWQYEFNLYLNFKNERMRKNLQFPKKHPGGKLRQKMCCAAITGIFAIAGSPSLHAAIKPAKLLMNPATQFTVKHSGFYDPKKTDALDFKFDHEVDGIVTDQNGNPLQGASVQVKGTNKGVITTATGKFILNVPENATLTVSSVGYETKEVKIGTSTTITIELKVAASDLNEVVVVGYGTQKKANLTGAVSQVTSEVLDNRSLPNLTQGLQGQIPNLNITMLDGKPTQSPSYNVRGTTSIGQGGNALV
jgi:hypothetical protein